MTTNFPSSIDAFTNPTSADTLDNPPHDQQHADINDAMEAVQTSLLDGAPLYIDDANERVGIGTTTPSAPLEIQGATGGVRIEPTVLTIGSNNDGYEFNIVGGTPDSFTDAGGRIRLGGGARGDGDVDSIIFLRDNTESMRIDSSGNVGIGTTSPASDLDVRGGILAHGSTGSNVGTEVGAITINNNSADGTVDFTQGLVFTDNVNGAGPWTHAGIVATGSSGFNGSLVFGTDGDSANNTTGIVERMRIDSSGNVNMPQQPMVSGTWTNGGTAVVNTNYTMNSLQTNVGNAFNVSTGVFTCPSDGKYLMSMTAIVYANPGYGYIDFRLNGTTYAFSHWSHDTTWVTGGGSFVMTASAGDALSMYIRSPNGNNGIYANSHNMGLIAKIA